MEEISPGNKAEWPSNLSWICRKGSLTEEDEVNSEGGLCYSMGIIASWRMVDREVNGAGQADANSECSPEPVQYHNALNIIRTLCLSCQTESTKF